MASLNPVPERTVRLLTLLPGQHGEPLRCAIEAVGLNDKVPYETLSYVWGPAPDGNHTVNLAGQTVDITSNLSAALSHLRNPETPRTLWVDQLCIDQGNNEEKEQQVGMMRSIYQNCTQCVIWLGVIPQDQDMFTLQDAMALFDFFKLHAAFESDQERFSQIITTFTRPSSYEGVRNAFGSMRPHGNDWWHRIWTVQEAVLPPKTTLQWGTLTISWVDLIGAFDTCPHSLHNVEMQDLDGIADAIRKDLGHLITAVLGLLISKEKRDTPLMLLHRWRSRYATDPRDKIYGLMGLLERDAFPSVPTSDYTVSTSTLYTRVALDMIRLTDSLEPLIGMRGDARVTPGLPSWVFDWAVLDEARSPNWFPFYHRHDCFRADGDKTFKMEVSDDERLLTLEGIYLDRVKHVSDVIADGKTELTEQDINDTLGAWKVFLDHVVREKGLETSPTGISWREVFCRTALGDLIFDEFPIRRVNDNDCEMFWKFRKDLQSNDTWESLRQMVTRQAFFITERGYVGIGPPTTRVGDSLWVLFGGRMPFILGAVGDEEAEPSNLGGIRKIFVGEAYVHGFMKGEAAEDEKSVRKVSLV
ncbi:hypothetical protein N0V84_006828 [Fusarium piperis]|uniref:Heterokaryon incompatibility domain-containing protein n=1 Tax=Fusarium piperis TaxID=1435070 RepID=A0A9W9BMH7_9HYPO|nr:hypothetical protein N0V84_006828 [Fusarium piperis]